MVKLLQNTFCQPSRLLISFIQEYTNKQFLYMYKHLQDSCELKMVTELEYQAYSDKLKNGTSEKMEQVKASHIIVYHY